MDPSQSLADEQPRPPYRTPTRSAAKVLEDILADKSSSKGSTHLSSRRSPATDTPEAGVNRPSPLPPLPPHHPARNSRTPPLPPLPPSSNGHVFASKLQEQPGPTVGHDDIDSHEDHRTSRKSKKAARSLSRRILEELRQHEQRRGTDYSPSESHRRHRSTTASHSRSSSDSISALLVVTSERLARETTRANEAERQANEVLALFKTAYEAKARLERDLGRVREELGLYKVQLDVAQKEIFRAQEIVNRVERQRVDAEDDAHRAREKMRKLMEVRAVEQAMEEGRRFGYEEGLRQGRMQQAREMEVQDENGRKSGHRRRNRADGDDRASDVSRYLYPKEPSQSSGSSGASVVKPTRTSPRTQRTVLSNYPKPPPPPSTSQTRPRRSSSAAPASKAPPDVASFPQTLPVPTITTPIPVNVPSSQPPVPVPMPPHQRSDTVHDHPHPPEKIKIQPSRDGNGPIHPIPYHNRSSSVAHAPIVLPPDNYIPVVGADSVISLPPPHELSIAVAPEAPPVEQGQGSATPRSRSRGRESVFRVINQDPPDRQSADRLHPSRAQRAPANPMSIKSGGSTYFSELDMLSPPVDYREYMPSEDRSATRSHTGSKSQSQPPPRTSGPAGHNADAVVEQWRSATGEYTKATSPPESHRSKRTAPAPESHTGGRDSRNQIERPTSTDTTYGKPSSLTGTRQIRTPRRPREVVLPVPLGEALPNFGGMPSRRRDDYAPPQSEDDALTPFSGYGRPTIQTSTSNMTLPGINVETPTTHTPSGMSERTHVDPVLLTPESANRIQPLPDHHEHDTSLGLGFDSFSTAGGRTPEHIEMTLPDNNLPEGFVPLSPISGMENLSSYPPGFAPSMPKDHPSGGTPGFTYSSPLLRAN